MNSLVPFEGNLFDIAPTFFRPVRQAWAGPRMDVNETESAYELAIELAGVKKEAIQVGVYENTVTITAETSEETPGQEQNWLLRERSFGRFSRTIALPEAVDDGSSQARYTDGVLYLTLQKKRATQVRRLTVH
jgi:HSP20 family protein